MHYNQYITSGQTSYKLREHFSMMILSIVATVVLLGALFYHRVSLLLSSVILLARPRRSARPVWNIWLLLPLAIILLPFNFAPMRKSMISAPAFRTFRKVMPPMSRTEKEAIDAGTTVGRRSVSRQS